MSPVKYQFRLCFLDDSALVGNRQLFSVKETIFWNVWNSSSTLILRNPFLKFLSISTCSGLPLPLADFPSAPELFFDFTQGLWLIDRPIEGSINPMRDQFSASIFPNVKVFFHFWFFLWQISVLLGRQTDVPVRLRVETSIMGFDDDVDDGRSREMQIFDEGPNDSSNPTKMYWWQKNYNWKWQFLSDIF